MPYVAALVAFAVARWWYDASSSEAVLWAFGFFAAFQFTAIEARQDEILRLLGRLPTREDAGRPDPDLDADD